MWKVIDGRKCTSNGLRLDDKLLHLPRDLINWLGEASSKELNEILGDDSRLLRLKTDHEKANKYLIRMWTRLQQYAIDAEMEKFEKLTEILRTHSKTMKWVALQQVEPNWMRKYSPKRIASILKAVNMSMIRRQYNFKATRVMIPKDDGEMRPLMVPTLKWRIMSKWYLWMLQIWVHQSNIICKRQFATTPNGGTAKAWNHVWNKVIDKKYIFEFDIAQCFNSILWHEVWNKLLEIHTPQNIANWIYCVMARNFHNISMDEFDKEEFKRLDTIYNRNPRKMWDRIKEGFIDPVATMEFAKKGDLIKKMDIHHWKDLLDIKWDLNKHKNWNKFSDVQSKMLEKIPCIIFENMVQQSNARGLPQGWALSPLLTDLVLSDVAVDFPGVYYLDDGIIADDELDKVNPSKLRVRLQELGLNFKEGKCHWVKFGEWLDNPLTFLGARHEKGRWYSATRNGGKIEISTEKLHNLKYGKENIPRPDLKTFISNYGCTELLSFLYNDGYKQIKDQKVKIEVNKFWEKLYRRYSYGRKVMEPWNLKH